MLWHSLRSKCKNQSVKVERKVMTKRETSFSHKHLKEKSRGEKKKTKPWLEGIHCNNK